MQPGKEILDEMRGLSSYLATLNKVVPFTVPEGYFNILPDAMLQSVTAAYSDSDMSLQNVTKINPYQVPSNYFDTLSADVLSAINSEYELPIVLPKINAQSTPAGYFDQLPAKLLAAAKAQEEPERNSTKTIPLGNTTWKNLRWAAAAVLVAGLGFGGYKMMQPAAVTPKASVEQRLAQVPDTVINRYIQQNIDDFDGDMIASVVAKNEIKTPVTKDQLTDKEIIDYLDETGWETSM